MPLEGRLGLAQDAVPLRHWSAQQLAQVETALDDFWRDWARAWDLTGPAGARVRAGRVDGGAAPPAGWHALHDPVHERRRAWLALGVPGQAPVQALCHSLFGVPAASPVAAEVAEAAWCDLLASVSRALGIVHANSEVRAPAPDSADCGQWAGALQLDLPVRGSSLRLLLSGACVEALVTPAPATAPGQIQAVVPALTRQRIRVTAALSAAELSVGSLRKLAIDDCLVLPHPLDQPLTLYGPGDIALCRAGLGSQAGYRAIELLAPTGDTESHSAVAVTAQQSKEPHVLTLDAVPTLASAATVCTDTPSATAQPIELADLDGGGQGQRSVVASQDDLLHQIRTRLQVSVGEVALTVGELLGAREQQVIRLDRRVEQPVDLLLEGAVVARGQLVAVDGHFAVRITELPGAAKA